MRAGYLWMAAAIGLLVVGMIMTISAGSEAGQGPPLVAWQLQETAAAPVGSLDGMWPDPVIWKEYAPITEKGFLRTFAGRACAYGFLAIIGMLFASRLNIRGLVRHYRWWSPLPWLTFATFLLCLSLVIPGVQEVVGDEDAVKSFGAWRWIQIGPFSFQPSELAKWVLVAMVAWLGSRRAGAGNRMTFLIPCGLLIMLYCGVVLAQKDLGSAALIGLLGWAMALVAGMRWWQGLLTAMTGVGMGVVFVFTEEYRKNRILAFLDPWKDSEDTGYQPIQSMVSFANGGLEGRGLGNGMQKYILPEDTTDFIFASLCEELGFSGGLLVLFLFSCLLFSGMWIAKNCKDPFGRMLVIGITFAIVFQAVINLMVVTVLMPTKGIALPLVSSGGTGWLLTMFCVGLVAAIDLENHWNNVPEYPSEETTKNTHKKNTHLAIPQLEQGVGMTDEDELFMQEEPQEEDLPV